jgi:hypothetical protein
LNWRNNCNYFLERVALFCLLCPNSFTHFYSWTKWAIGRFTHLFNIICVCVAYFTFRNIWKQTNCWDYFSLNRITSILHPFILYFIIHCVSLRQIFHGLRCFYSIFTLPQRINSALILNIARRSCIRLTNFSSITFSIKIGSLP